MGRMRRAYLPRWTAWFTLGLLGFVWIWLTWRTFVSESDTADLGATEWLVVSVILGAVAVVIVLMGTRRLPAYLIEESEEEGEGP